MKIRFIKQTDERQHGAAYNEGDTVDLPFPSANRWVRRALAVEVKPEPEPVRLRGRPMMSTQPAVAEPPAAEAEEKPRRGRPSKKKDA